MLENLIGPENIILDLSSEDKDELFSEMTENLVRRNPSLDRHAVLSALEERESLKNTCIRQGVAVPHANFPSIKKPEIAVGISRSGIDYEISGKFPAKKEDLIHLVIMILFEPENTQNHLHILADCAMLLNDSRFYNQIMKASCAREVCNIIKEVEYGRIGS